MVYTKPPEKACALDRLHKKNSQKESHSKNPQPSPQKHGDKPGQRKKDGPKPTRRLPGRRRALGRAAARSSRRSRASACPATAPTRLDEAEASPAQEALDQARVQQLTPDSHDELVSNAADNDERRAARDGRAQYERRVRAQDEAPPPPSAAIRQAVDRAAARSPGRSVTSHSSGDAPSQEEAPSEYMCPITLSMMADPVVANDGHSYERAAIAHWLATHNTSPQTREPMVSRELVPNHALRARIAAWRTQRGLDPSPARWIPPAAPRRRPRRSSGSRGRRRCI